MYTIQDIKNLVGKKVLVNAIERKEFGKPFSIYLTLTGIGNYFADDSIPDDETYPIQIKSTR